MTQIGLMTHMNCVLLVSCNTLIMQATCNASAGTVTLTMFCLGIMCARVSTVTLTVFALA